MRENQGEEPGGSDPISPRCTRSRVRADQLTVNMSNFIRFVSTFQRIVS